MFRREKFGWAGNELHELVAVSAGGGDGDGSIAGAGADSVCRLFFAQHGTAVIQHGLAGGFRQYRN